MSMRSVAARAGCASTPSSRPRKLSEVYVLVPHSPYSLSTSEAIGTRTANDFHNPPTPLRVHNMQSASSTPGTIKRKYSEEIPNETELRVGAPETKMKRRKVSATETKAQSATRATHTEASNATPEFPNGFFYCHQCNKKRDSACMLSSHLAFSGSTNRHLQWD
jgi:hypothetical protein